MDYIQKMRMKIGRDRLILVASNIIIYDEDNNYYLQKRADGKLAFIGGFVEINESVIEGLIRETKEEVNLNLEEKRLEFYGMYTKFKMEYPNGDKVKPHSMFFKYKLKKHEKLEAMPPETIEVVKCELSTDLAMLNVQHEAVLKDLITGRNGPIIS